MTIVHPDDLRPGMDVVYSEDDREWEGTVVEVFPRIVRLELRPPAHFHEGPGWIDPEMIREEDLLPEVQMIDYATTISIQKKYGLPSGHWTEPAESRRFMWALDTPMSLKRLQEICREQPIDPDDPMCWIRSATVRVWPVRKHRYGEWKAEPRGFKEWRPRVSGRAERRPVAPRSLRPGMYVTYREFENEFPGTVREVSGRVVYLDLDRPVHYMDLPMNAFHEGIHEAFFLDMSSAAYWETAESLRKWGVARPGEWMKSRSGLDLYEFEEPMPLAEIRRLCEERAEHERCWRRAGTLRTIAVNTAPPTPGDPAWFAGLPGSKEWAPNMGIMLPERTYSSCKISWQDPAGEQYLSFDAIVRENLTGAMVHVALPVERGIPGRAIFAGRPKARDFAEIRSGYEEIAGRHGFELECAERLTAQELAEFLMDPLWAGGLDTGVVMRAWEGVQRILNHALGPL